MFSERLNQALESTGSTTAQLARALGCDRSNVSRMRNGARIPKRGGVAARRLVNGLYALALEHGKVPELRALASCGPDATANETTTCLMSWLFENAGETYAGEGASNAVRTQAHHVFGERLDAVMRLAELSNVRFGRMINVDASYISRFRNGLRSPRSNPEMMSSICTALLERLESREQTDQLAELIGAAPDAMDDPDEAFTLLHDWLFETDSCNNGDIARLLIASIGSFTPNTPLPPNPTNIPAIANMPTHPCSTDPTNQRLTDQLAGTALSTEMATYFGIAGLRSAVTHFLGSVTTHDVRELCLYSDQGLGWMVGDDAFRDQWASLMAECVRGRIKITIIHNVDRNLSEMVDAITNWLPLYLSGMIESYYCRRQRSARFSNTLFLCPGHACLTGVSVAGQEDASGIYRLDTAAETLAAHGRTFDTLLAESHPLVHVRPASAEESIPTTRSSTTFASKRTRHVASFPNTRVTILENMVTVTRLNEPRVTFTISHPALRRAFAVYLNRGDKESPCPS